MGADAFVEARAPARVESEPVSASADLADDDRELTDFACMSGVPDYRNVGPGDWSGAQLARAWRGGVLRALPDEFWDQLADDEEEE